MVNKRKKYNARFAPARIKKIMQKDEEIGKVAAAVPVIISRALELFVQSLVKKAEGVTRARNARTLTPAHLKASILADPRLHFLRETVASVPDVVQDEDGLETGASFEPLSNAPASTSSSPSSVTNAQVSRSRGRPPGSGAQRSTRPRSESGSVDSAASGGGSTVDQQLPLATNGVGQYANVNYGGGAFHPADTQQASDRELNDFDPTSGHMAASQQHAQYPPYCLPPPHSSPYQPSNYTGPLPTGFGGFNGVSGYPSLVRCQGEDDDYDT